MVLDLDELGYSTTHTPFIYGLHDATPLPHQHKWVKATEGVVIGHPIDGCLPDFEARKDHTNDGRYWKYETLMEFTSRICGVEQ